MSWTGTGAQPRVRWPADGFGHLPSWASRYVAQRNLRTVAHVVLTGATYESWSADSTFEQTARELFTR